MMSLPNLITGTFLIGCAIALAQSLWEARQIRQARRRRLEARLEQIRMLDYPLRPNG